VPREVRLIQNTNHCPWVFSNAFCLFEKTLELSLQQVPKSVEILKDKVDFYCKLYNAPCADGIQLLSDHLTWESFKTTWLQTCAWVPKPPASKKLRQVSGN
jgi:hypothetical protein